jgi:PHD/YefM family antitoxin component YafN of YafNO toxin-antitoxin module
MPELHPQFITDGEAKRFVVLPFSEWEMLREMLEDARDLQDLRAAKSDGNEEEPLSLAQVHAELGLNNS